MNYYLDFGDIFKRGLEYFANEVGTTESIEITLGKPDSIEKYKNDRLNYHYDNFRFDFSKSVLEQVVIYFYNYDVSYPIHLPGEERVELSNKIDVCTLLQYLNTNGRRWQINYEESKLDYLTIRLESGLKILFYLEEVKLERIVVYNIK